MAPKLYLCLSKFCMSDVVPSVGSNIIKHLSESLCVVCMCSPTFLKGPPISVNDHKKRFKTCASLLLWVSVWGWGGLGYLTWVRYNVKIISLPIMNMLGATTDLGVRRWVLGVGRQACECVLRNRPIVLFAAASRRYGPVGS